MRRNTQDPDEVARDAPRGQTPSELGRRSGQGSQQGSGDVIAGRGAAARFVGRVAQLDHEAVRVAVAAWRQNMRSAYDTWFAAEDQVAQAIVRSGRHMEQRPLLIHMADAFSQRVWTGRPRVESGPAERLVHATEASGQYLATLAMLAVLVRDHLDAATFEQVYQPFAALIPIAELAPE
jgi:hypothetical protein